MVRIQGVAVCYDNNLVQFLVKNPAGENTPHPPPSTNHPPPTAISETGPYIGENTKIQKTQNVSRSQQTLWFI